jgi:uncharacterized membrane protein YjjB (DUF3815 family)
MTTGLLQCFWAFLATAGFAVVFKAPLRDLPIAATGGALAWGTCLLSQAASGSEALAYLSASIAVGLYAETAAALLKRPASLFILCAIIPLVPGGGMYYTMFEAVSGNGELAAALGFQTLILAGSIAAGLAIASAIARIFTMKGISLIKPRRSFRAKRQT